MTAFIGIDIAKKNCVVCISDQNNTIREVTSYRNTSQDATEFARRALRAYGDCKAVVESTGNMWLKTYEAFESEGIEIKLANPSKTRIIAESKIKTDKLDAKVLSRLLRGDLIAECYVPTRKVRLSRALLGHRVNIAREQTRIRNRVHALLTKYDILEHDDGEHDNNIASKRGIAWLKTVNLEGHDQEILDSLVRQLEFLDGEEESANKVIAKDATKNDYVPMIMSMPGFDYGASFIAAYIADIDRFPTPSHLVSWVGLCPSIHQTGETTYMGKMKGGSKKACWMMVQAANAAIRSDERLRRYYERKAKRLHHNVAITHVANKMLRILWHMLMENRLYEQRSEERYNSKLKRLQRIASD
jgi:transposase